MSTQVNPDVVIALFDSIFKPLGLVAYLAGIGGLIVNLHALLAIAKKIPMFRDFLVFTDGIPLVGSIIQWMMSIPESFVLIVATFTSILSTYFLDFWPIISTIALIVLLMLKAIFNSQFLYLIPPIIIAILLLLRLNILPISMIPFGTQLVQFSTIIALALALITLFI